MKKICAFKHRKIQNMYLHFFFRSCHVAPHFAYALSLFRQFFVVFDIPLSFSVLLSIFVMCLSLVMFLQSADPCRWHRGARQRSNCQQHGCFFLSVRKQDARKNKRKKQTKEKVARASKILEKKASSKNKAEEKNKLQEHARHGRRKHGARANTRKQ